MRYTVLSMVLVVALTVSPMGQVDKAFAQSQTRLSGVVNMHDNLPAAGARLYISCGTSTRKAVLVDVQNVKADKRGHYEAKFDPKSCAVGATISGNVYAGLKDDGINSSRYARINETVTSTDMTLDIMLDYDKLGDANSTKANAKKTAKSTSPQKGSNIATVVIDCTGLERSRTSKLFESRWYYATFAPDVCTKKTEVTASATQDGSSGVGHGKIKNGYAVINVPLVPVAAVPEMGTVAAIGAGGAVGGMFLMVRRKQMQI